MRVKRIEWKPHPYASHATNAFVEGRRIAVLYDENANPLKPAGSPPQRRPFNLELHLPLPKGADRVIKFTNPQTAKTEAQRQLDRFLSAIVET